jgi:uncharacterized protein (DUF3820 family)
MKPRLVRFVSVLLFGAIVILFIAFVDPIHRGKWLSSAGLISDIAGITQLDIVGFMEGIFENYSDLEKYPGGPPSHITRRIIDNPDTPMRNWFAQKIFYERQSGFYMIVVVVGDDNFGLPKLIQVLRRNNVALAVIIIRIIRQ